MRWYSVQIEFPAKIQMPDRVREFLNSLVEILSKSDQCEIGREIGDLLVERIAKGEAEEGGRE